MNRPTISRVMLSGVTTVVAAVTVHGAGSSDGDFRPAMWASTALVT